MREMLVKLPEGDWLCEECKCAEETTNQRLGNLEVLCIHHFLFEKSCAWYLKRVPCLLYPFFSCANRFVKLYFVV